jgi:spermidine synthase
MALWLRRSLPDTELHVAELLPSVAASAPCFGLDTKDPNLHIHVGDGRGFLAGSNDNSYDSILVDAFDDNASLPVCFRTHEFFALARRKLATGGALVLNLLNSKDSLGVLRSLKSQFDDDRVFVGEAPGAQGIQNIIAAYATGSLRGKAAATVSPPSQATAWLAAAHFRPLKAGALDSVAALEDSALCPKSGQF